VEGLLQRTQINPKDIDIVVTLCSIYCPTPSMASMLVNKFNMRSDVQSYHLGGMGCSNGVIAINLVRDLLRVRKVKMEF
jgi:3-ketoacyl-CoA synthase